MFVRADIWRNIVPLAMTGTWHCKLL